MKSCQLMEFGLIAPAHIDTARLKWSWVLCTYVDAANLFWKASVIHIFFCSVDQVAKRADILHENYHSGILKTTSVQLVQLCLYHDLPQRKLEAAECLQSFLIQATASHFEHTQVDSAPVHVYWDRNSGPLKYPSWAVTVDQLNFACDRADCKCSPIWSGTWKSFWIVI